MLDVQVQKIPTAEAILASKFIERFLFEESLRGNYGERAVDEALGQRLEQYKEQYEEKRTLGEGGQGKIMLVKRKKNGVYFAAKQQLDEKHFVNTK